MLLLVLRLVSAPLVILAATMAQRRFGHAVSGLIVGLPLTTLPLLWLVALGHGTPFAGSMSAALLTASSAQVALIWSYARLARHLSPLAAATGSVAVFAVVALFTRALHPSAPVAALLGVVSCVLALRAWPTLDATPVAEGRYRVGLRVALVTLFTLLVVTFAGWMGPQLAGLVAALPALSLVMAVVTHRELGASATSQFLRSVTRGSIAYVISILVMTELLRAGQLTLAVVGTLVGALVVQASLYLGEQWTAGPLARRLATRHISRLVDDVDEIASR
ncbi:MAG: hypothetical protein ACP5PB_05910 [Acidimicrobiales bacterium]